MEYLEDYQFTLSYHPEKANVVADALSRKTREIVANISIKEWEMVSTVNGFKLQPETHNGKGRLFTIVTTPQLLTKVLEA